MIYKKYAWPFILVTTLFLLWGFAHGLLDVLDKHFQTTLHISKAQSGFVQFSLYIGYLVMAGPANHAYGIEMQKLAEELGLGPSVTWPGMITGDLKWGCLRSADAFILPSHQENFGISVVEAMACGVPVLISNKINIWCEIENDRAGLVENDDLQGTIQLLQRWFALPSAQCEEMRTNSRLCFETRFTIAKTAQSLTSLLRR